MQSRRIAVVFTVCILSILVVSQTPVSAIDPILSNLNIGPYVDKIVYEGGLLSVSFICIIYVVIEKFRTKRPQEST